VAAAQRPPRVIPARINGEGRAPAVVAVSALTGEGLPELFDAIEQRIAGGRQTYAVELKGEALASLHLLYEIGEVLERTDMPDGATIARVRVPAERATLFRRSFPSASQVA
jgi:GTP-binding protein HflX